MIPIGYVKRAHGIRGDVLVRPLSDAPGRRYDVGVMLETDEQPSRRLEITAVRPHKEGILVSFEGISTRNQAEAMRGVSFVIGEGDRRPLAADEYWPGDLVGLAVEDVSGVALGSVSEVVFGVAQDRLVVTTPAGDKVEVPFVSAIVVEVAPSEGRAVIDPPEGLFSL